MAQKKVRKNKRNTKKRWKTGETMAQKKVRKNNRTPENNGKTTEMRRNWGNTG